MKKFFCLLTILLCLPLLSSAETVVTSFYPIWLITQNLTRGVENLTLINLTSSSTGCLHDYTLQNSDMTSLAQADALLINGAGMEPFLPVIASAHPDLPVIDASEGIPASPQFDALTIGDSEEEGLSNPHLWMDPQRASAMAANLAEGLIRLFPDRAEQISENLAEYRTRMDMLDQSFRAASEETSRKKVIIFHEALPYFAEACGLQVVAVVNKEPEDDLSPAQLAEVLELIRSGTDLPLILQSAEEDRSVSVLVRETGAPVCMLDPVTSGPDQPPLDYYDTVMAQNLSLILDAMR